MLTTATLFLASPSATWSKTALQAVTGLKALLLGMAVLALCLVIVRRITRAHWEVARDRLSLHLHNHGNVPGVFRLQAFAPQNDLEFRFTQDGLVLPESTAQETNTNPAPPAPGNGKAMDPDSPGTVDAPAGGTGPTRPVQQYVQIGPIEPGGEQILELQLAPRRWHRTAEYDLWVLSHQVEQPGFPCPETQVDGKIVHRASLSRAARWFCALKLFLIALTILISIAWPVALILWGAWPIINRL